MSAFPELLEAIERGAFHALPGRVEALTEKPNLLLLHHPPHTPPTLVWRSPGFAHSLPSSGSIEDLHRVFPDDRFTLLPVRHRDILLGWWVVEGSPHPRMSTLLPHLAASWYLHLDSLLDQKIHHLTRALKDRVLQIRQKLIQPGEVFGMGFLREVAELFPGVHVFFLRQAGHQTLEIRSPEKSWVEEVVSPITFPEDPVHVRSGEFHPGFPSLLQDVLRTNAPHSWLLLPLTGDPHPEALVLSFESPPHPLTLGALNDLFVSLSWARVAVQQIERLSTHENQLERFVNLAQSFQQIRDSRAFMVHLLDLFESICQTPTGAALLLTEDGRELEVVAGRGDWEKLDGTRFHRHQGLAGHALNRGQIVVSEHYEKDPRLGNSPYVRGLRWGLGIPLILPSGNPLGVIVLGTPDSLPCLEDLDFLETLTQVAMQMYDRMQKDRELLHSYRDILNLLMRTLALREHGTHEHTARVTALALALGKKLGLDDRDLLTLYWGAMLHDIGKIGIPDHILQKPGPLTDEEWQVMRRHPEFGREILRDLRFLQGALDVVYHHHERYDGKGYPGGLRGHDIPYLARIFSVVDAFDAMISDRPYRKGMSVEDALRELARNRGTQFDPDIVDAFIQLIQERPELVENPRTVFENLSPIFHLYQLFMQR